MNEYEESFEESASLPVDSASQDLVRQDLANQDLPDNLPPVEPPSAGFLIQLFLIPGVIVLAVVGVWALFGRISAGDQDWQKLVVELRSNNEHRRWRGASGLAHLLQVDSRLEADGQQLSRNNQIADELTQLFRAQLANSSPDDDDLKQQSFLARTLGFLEVDGTVVPALQEAIKPQYDRDVRMDALAALATIAGRNGEHGTTLDATTLVEDVITVSADGNPLVRQLAAFTLGLLPGKASHARLEVLVDDADANVRVNAAIGLTRQESTAGLPIFRQILSDSDGVRQAAREAEASQQPRSEIESQQFGGLLALHNSLKAVGELSPLLTAEERREFVEMIRPISADFPNERIRIDAKKSVRALEQGE